MLSFYVSGSPGFVFLNPLSLATDDCRSVLAVKGSLRRFAPWTAAGRSERRAVHEGKGGLGPGLAGPEGNLVFPGDGRGAGLLVGRVNFSVA